ncbi:isocitrate lyase/phosphoenolpyruvate mutase family protein [Pendulispora brunnea]|uniref:Isocitrate lyase/phosphoenolpyruvate mutase family protein n=1 Tax=Pendulispora brunnea TaxID=2905690 RepID=A0ABZ2K0D4_9BACT
MIRPSMDEKAAKFSRMHDAGCFILPNAWDTPSALLACEAGFGAVATTSAGVALAHGFPDGERIGRTRMLEVAGSIARRLPVAVTADLEAGYGPEPEDVAASIRAAIDAGIVGCNIEDTDPRKGALFELGSAVARLRAGVRAARDAGLANFVLNARIDTFFVGTGSAEERVAEAIRRGNAYLEAGARCVFVPGPVDTDTIGALVKGIQGPLNVWGGVGDRLAPVESLRALGVRRVSLGAGPMLATYAFTKQLFTNAAANRDVTFDGAGSMFGELTKLTQKYDV